MDIELMVILNHIRLIGFVIEKYCGMTFIPNLPYTIDLQVSLVKP